MKTIYEQFMECKQARTTDVRSNPLIVQKLINLFYKAYGIDLSDNVGCFNHDVSSIGEKISVGYKFQYGSVNISNEKEQLEVTFFHNNKFKAPFQANRCRITVDHNLNFIKATYSMYFSFLNSILYNNGGSRGYNQIKIQRVIDLNGAYNHLAFRHSESMDDDRFTDVEKSKLDDRFLNPNTAFEEDFYKIIDFATACPHEFYAVFNDYPSFSKCVEHSDAIIDFVNVFTHQYFSDHERLKQNLLLIDMQAI